MTGSFKIFKSIRFSITRKVFAWGLVTSLLPLFLIDSAEAQNIIDKLDRASRSSFNAFAINANKQPLDTARGFFISADGLAITTASVFQTGDTVLFTDEKDRPLELQRIIAFHTYSNLALIQLKNPRVKEIDFLLPSKKAFGSSGEILAFTNNKDAEGGLGYGSMGKITRITFLGRCATINMQAGAASECAPIMNEMGDHIGMYYFNGSKKTGFLLPVTVINDDNWISVNQTWSNFKKNPQRLKLTTTHYCQALVYFSQSKWLEAARSFTALLKTSPEDAQVHALRSLTRYKYGNNVGAREDFTYSLKIDPNGYLPYYSRAQFHLGAKDKVKALEDLFSAVDKNPNFADAFLEIGRIQTFMGDIKMAFASLSFALETDSLLAEAWYERGRLYIQHSTNMDKALGDLFTAARLDPSLPGVYTLIGNIKLNRLDYLEAIQEFDNAINQDGRDTHALMNRGMAYFNTGLKEKACADWDQAGKQGNIQAFKLISRHCAEIRKGTLPKPNR